MDLNNIKILCSEKEIQEGIRNLGTKLNQIYGSEELYLICVLRGAVMFYTDLSKHLTMPVRMEFVRFSSYGCDFHSSGNVEYVDGLLPDLNDKNVLIIEDIVDTGRTARCFLDYINSKYKPKDLKFCSLLVKKQKREVEIEPDYHVFDIDDKFVIGYGLDYKEFYRNLPYIGYIDT